jgi:hypothetical protein
LHGVQVVLAVLAIIALKMYKDHVRSWLITPYAIYNVAQKLLFSSPTKVKLMFAGVIQMDNWVPTQSNIVVYHIRLIHEES